MTIRALRTRTARLAPALSLALAAGASAQTCEPAFSDAFASPDLNGQVNAIAVFNDGTGPALYVGGNFTTAGGATVNRIAKWNGRAWAPLASGLNGVCSTMTVHDEDGPGPIPAALYVGGSFTSAGGVTANRIAKWNGSAFSAVGNADNTVLSLVSTVVNGVPELYAAGSFASIGGIPAARVARLSSGTWSALGTGVNNTVNALAIYDDGAGADLYAGGAFTTAGGLAASRIARWDGAQWSPVGDGVGADVKALYVHTDATGANLYAAGLFTTAGAISANRIARWDGSQWSELAAGLNNACNAMGSFNGKLYAAGTFTTAGGLNANHIATFDGTDWAPVGSGISGTGNTLAVFDLGKGPELLAGGSFSNAGDVSAPNLGRWNNQSWTDIGRGANATVQTITTHNGEAIVAGDFTRIAGERATRIAAFDGQTFRPLGDGFASAPLALASFDPDGAGPVPATLYAGGNFTQTGSGNTVSRFARWDGTQWLQVGSGVNGVVNSMVVFDDGSGPAVFLGGSFTTVNGAAANRVARWDGSVATPLGAGLNGAVSELVVHNGALYAVGSFTASGTTAINRIAVWERGGWLPLGVGANNTVNTAASYNGQLYVGGTFTSIGGISANRMGRWDGTAWNDVAGGATGTVKTMSVFDDGHGQALYAGGDFTGVGAPVVPTSRLARFDGAWTAAIGGGADNSVEALCPLQIGPARTLLVGGSFRALGGVSSDRVGVLTACTATCYANCDGSTVTPVLNVNDFICFQQKYAAADPAANCDGSTTTPVLNVNDFICFQQKYAAGCQ